MDTWHVINAYIFQHESTIGLSRIIDYFSVTLYLYPPPFVSSIRTSGTPYTSMCSPLLIKTLLYALMSHDNLKLFTNRSLNIEHSLTHHQNINTAYLNSMLTPTRNSRQLRSTSRNPLYIPRVKTKAGTRAFSVAAPTVWNSLPASVKSQGNIVSFRRHLKTYLFNAAYPP